MERIDVMIGPAEAIITVTANGLGLHMTQPCVSHMVSHASRTHTTHGPCMYGSCGGPWAVATYRARGTRVQAVQELAVTTELTLQRGHGFTG